ncbi:hypothetical protein HYQ46_006183 [Verticillium longisporum]|nr:hypothetical protein HYQ46_006183 [Verticillium longisporum]
MRALAPWVSTFAGLRVPSQEHRASVSPSNSRLLGRSVAVVMRDHGAVKGRRCKLGGRQTSLRASNRSSTAPGRRSSSDVLLGCGAFGSYIIVGTVVVNVVHLSVVIGVFFLSFILDVLFKCFFLGEFLMHVVLVRIVVLPDAVLH